MTGWVILVHPGSMFGSAEAGLGRQAARDAREGVLAEIEATPDAGLVTIHGFFSDEIGPVWGARLAAAERARRDAGFPVLRLWGCDNFPAPPPGRGAFDAIFTHQTPAAEHVATLLGPGDDVLVTGAWHDPGGETGCVTGVAETIRARATGVTVRVSDEALVHPDFSTSPEP